MYLIGVKIQVACSLSLSKLMSTYLLILIRATGIGVHYSEILRHSDQGILDCTGTKTFARNLN